MESTIVSEGVLSEEKFDTFDAEARAEATESVKFAEESPLPSMPV